MTTTTRHQRVRSEALNLPPSSPFIQWYWHVERLHLARFNLGTSYIEILSPSEWPLAPNDFPLHTERDPLKSAIARTYGVQPLQIIPTAGASDANLQMVDLLLKPGDHVLVEQPSYEPLRTILQGRRVRLLRFPRGIHTAFQTDLKTLKNKMSSKVKLIILTLVHNPSGVAMPSATLKEIGAIAKRYGAYVLCDEVFSEFLKPGTWQPAVTLGDHFISTNSFSKAFGLSGLRIGWGLASPRLAEAANRRLQSITMPWAEPVIRVACKAFRDLSWIRQRNHRKASANWQIVKHWLAAHPQFEWTEPSGGVVCAIRSTTPFNSLKFSERLLKHRRTLVTPGDFFEMPGALRIGFGIPTSLLRQGLHHLSQGLAEKPFFPKHR